MKKRNLEAKLQSRVLAWLKDTGLLHWRQQSGNLFMGTRRVNMGPAGLPDIVVILPPGGRFLGIELKSPDGKQNESQIDMATRMLQVGAVYTVCRSIQEVMDVVCRHVSKERWEDIVRATNVARRVRLDAKNANKRLHRSAVRANPASP